MSNPNPNLGHLPALARGEPLPRVMTICARDCGMSLPTLQELRLVVEPDRYPALHPPAVVDVLAVLVVVVAKVGNVHHVHPYVCARECVHNHVQTEAPRR